MNESTGKREWPKFPDGERPLLHGNHDESIIYANEGNRFAYVSSDAYHIKTNGDGATIMVSGVHKNTMSNINKVIDEFERLYPECQLLLIGL